MQYVLLIYVDEERFAALTKEERNQVHRDCGAWHEELVKSGKAVSAMALQRGSTATTLRKRGGKVVVTDGPFAETKEVFGGCEIIECQDMDEATAIAERFPGLRAGGAVEVRPAVTGGDCTEP